jgi:UDP-N-acetylbacillosamine transaminase
MRDRIFLSPPHIGEYERKFVNEAFDENYIAPLGKNVDGFEDDIKEFVKVENALAVSSGTSAIHLSLRVLDIKEGDEVFVSTFTFIGSVAPVMYEKCKPFFIDSDIDSWNMSPLLLEKEILKRVKKNKKLPKALIVTHLYGQMAKIEEIKRICDTYKIYLIEDAAESLGATYNNQHSGTFGVMGIYSFNGNKIITTGGGGMLVSNNADLIKRARFLSTQAKEPKIYYEHKTFGYNYRMSNITAGIGRGQMRVLDSRILRRREIFDIYKSELSDIADFMPEIENSFGNRWLTTIVFKNSIDIFEIIERFEDENIETRPLWKPMHSQPLFKKSKSIGGDVSEKLFENGLCLPSGTAMTDDMARDISKMLKGFLNGI